MCDQRPPCSNGLRTRIVRRRNCREEVVFLAGPFAHRFAPVRSDLQTRDCGPQLSASPRVNLAPKIDANSGKQSFDASTHETWFTTSAKPPSHRVNSFSSLKS